jgi:purine-binding chemotaxis protein CheW
MSNLENAGQISDTGFSRTASRAGKFLTFRLGAEEFGLEILRVREIIGLMDITRVPRTPPYIRGVINLRGKVIPVLELRSKFSMDIIEDTEETCIIVVDITIKDNSILMGVLVDGVSEVLDIKETDIQDAPAFGGNINTDFILGIGKLKDGVKILLDIDKVIITSDFSTAVANGRGERDNIERERGTLELSGV